MEPYVAAEWSPIEMLQRAWERALPHLPILIGICFATWVVQFGINFAIGMVQGVVVGIATVFADKRGGDGAQALVAGIRLVLQLAATALTLPLSVLVSGALARLGLSVARGEAPDMGVFSVAFSRIGSLLGAFLLMTLAIVVGCCMCFLPGIVVAIGLQFTMMIVMDTDLGAFGALSYAWKLASDHLLNLFVFGLIASFAVFVAFCGTCGLGLIVVAPIVLVAQGLVYVHLSGRSQDFMPDPSF